MKQFIRHSFLGAALVLGITGSARANSLTFLLSVPTIEALNLGSANGCSSGLANCGVTGIGLNSVSGQTISSYTISIPGLTTLDNWTLVSSGFAPTTSTGYEAPDTSTNKLAVITADSTISTANGGAGWTYVTKNPVGGPAMNLAQTSTGGSALSSLGIISATTNLQIAINFTGAAPVTDTLSLDFVGIFFKADGSQDTTKSWEQLANVTLTASTPEPSSILLVLGGVACIGIGRLRRKRAQ